METNACFRNNNRCIPNPCQFLLLALIRVGPDWDGWVGLGPDDISKFGLGLHVLGEPMNNPTWSYDHNYLVNGPKVIRDITF